VEGVNGVERLDRSDRLYLEAALARLAQSGHIPARGEREVTVRIDKDGRIRWFQATRIRAPASELDTDTEPDDP
jgi:hypothetical protein